MNSFTWTGGPDQTDDPTWLTEYMSSGQVKIENAGSPEVRLSFFGFTVSPGAKVMKATNALVVMQNNQYQVAITGDLSLDDIVELLQIIPPELKNETVRSHLAKIKITNVQSGDGCATVTVEVNHE